jgi:hypothetical protein
MNTDVYEPLNGHDLLGGHTNARGQILVTKPRHFWPWLRGRDRAPRHAPDHASRWLRSAMAALGMLAAAAAIVSFQAQYRMIYGYKHNAAIAATQAAIPDIGALVFASLGIALALRGKPAARARILNVVCVAISIAMNALAAASGWSALAVWIMAPVLYALASDTLIGVIRSMQAEDDSTPLAMVGKVALWSLRLILAPPSTAAGARRLVLAATPLPSPGSARAIEGPALEESGDLKLRPARQPVAPGRDGTKTSRLLALAAERHDLPVLPLGRVSAIATALAAEAALHPSTARRVLLAHVRALQNGSAS